MTSFPASSNRFSNLLPQHLLMLRDESGIANDIIAERGYFSVTTYSDARRLGFADGQCNVPALVVPQWNVEREQAGYQLRSDVPRQSRDGKIIKYETPAKARLSLDVPPRCKDMLRNPNIPLHVTEGSKKADALASHGLCAVSVSGVWGWRGKNEYDGLSTIGDWDGIALNERKVRLVFDSDVLRKAPVARALQRLKEFLERKRAIVEVVYLRDTEDGGKQGIDDFLVNGGTVEDLDRFTSDVVHWPEGEESDRPTIVTTNRSLEHLSDDCWKVLVEANEPNPKLFQRTSQMVRVDTQGTKPVIRAVREDDLRFRLERLADFKKQTARGELVPGRVPVDVLKDMLVAWNKPLPALHGVVGAPLLAADGTITLQRGYHWANGLFFDPGDMVLPGVPEAPSSEEVSEARATIDEWLCDFPFDTPASRANVLAMVLTYLAREMIDGPTPLFVVSAPTQGTGKGLLAQTAGIIMEGSPPSMTTAPRDADEWRKRITSQLQEGGRLFLIDNVKRRLASAELAAALTAEEWSDRVLGTNETVRVSNRAVWVATGNNVGMDGEVSRRAVLIRLDAKLDRPWAGRIFRHEFLSEWVREHRSNLIWAFLVLCRAWMAAGMPAFEGWRPGSFESWARVVGGILQTVGVEGFLENREMLYRKADDETEEWREFVTTWGEVHGQHPIKVADLVDLVLRNDLLESLCASSTNPTDEGSLRIKLGKAVSRRVDRRFGDWYIRSLGIDAHQKGRRYALEAAQDAEAEPAPSAKPPRDLECCPGSTAENAECAEGVFQLEGEAAWRDHDPKVVAPSGFNFPRPPHLPPPGSTKEVFDGGEHVSQPESLLRAESDPPRCSQCGVTMSVVAVSDICGRCQHALRRKQEHGSGSRRGL